MSNDGRMLPAVALLVVHFGASSLTGGTHSVIEQLYKDAPSPYWLDPSKNSGAACVYFIDQCFRADRTYKDIATLCPPGQYGSTLKEIDDTCERLGYDTMGFTGTPSSLKRLRYPAIVRWELKEDLQQLERKASDHFVTVVGWDDREKAFLTFDPPREIRRVPYGEMKRNFAGVGLVVSDEKLTSLEEVFYPKPPRLLPFLVGLGIGWASLIVWRMRGTSRSATPLPLLLALITILMPGCSRSGTDASSAHQFDAGKVPAGSTVSHVFRAYNLSPKPLQFVDLEGDCACTKSLIGDIPQTVMPEEFAEVRVELDTQDFSGPTERRILVVTDAEDAEYKMIRLTLRFDARQAVEPPKGVYFGDVRPEADAEELLRIKLARPELAAAFLSADCDQPWMQVGEAVADDEWLTIKVLLKAGKKPSGTLVGTIHVRFCEASISSPEGASTRTAEFLTVASVASWRVSDN